MSISLRTAFLPILATALVCQPRLAPETLSACLQAIKLPGAILDQFKMTRKPQS